MLQVPVAVFFALETICIQVPWEQNCDLQDLPGKRKTAGVRNEMMG